MNGHREKAVAALAKLNISPLLSANERQVISDSITYLKTRRDDYALNIFGDKYFLGKIATVYVFSILPKADWAAVLKSSMCALQTR